MSQSQKKRNKNNKKTGSRTDSRSTPIILAVIGALVIVAVVVFLLVKSQNGDSSVTDDFIPSVAGQPSLKADREEIDLGDVKLGKTVQASFTLTNVGDQELRFTEIPYIELKEGC